MPRRNPDQAGERRAARQAATTRMAKQADARATRKPSEHPAPQDDARDRADERNASGVRISGIHPHQQ